MHFNYETLHADQLMPRCTRVFDYFREFSLITPITLHFNNSIILFIG